ncbi:hypothetical protein TTHERM_01108600 (macronuclear) [Tetrahymena thermophila SB210]|uniref:Uncharacterized protein n=1 Tax=Tetrahymena thermophila (strain SB210) TaxID=312017 RepID=Q22B95_TETTS|nr:hypothetical protein TTHERM_01108600 [Tetrahymena thermophila SB210]EAR82558.1 hypothetical protein TTHERM_01108600 [Tetrahymena thermophila SB210]|eukprot:XP_001030221.1 hypothetical protein TTHERM_01108600 [Tetrahymena thermophila SB210]
MLDYNSKQESQQLIKNLTIFKDHCSKNQSILQYLIEKFQSWGSLLERNKNLPVELEYQKIVQTSKKYINDIKNNYQSSLQRLKNKETEKQQEVQVSEKQNQTIVEKNIQNQQEKLDDISQNKNDLYKIQKKAVFRIKPKKEPQKLSNYEKIKKSLKKFVQTNYRITPLSNQRKPKRKPVNIDQEEEQLQENNSFSGSNEQNKDLKNQNQKSIITPQANNEADANQSNQSKKIIDERSNIYEIDNTLLTKNDMSIQKISNFYIEKRFSFEDYLKQIVEFEDYFEVKVPDFFKDKEIHHYRMIMNNYQIGHLKIDEVLGIKKLVEVSQNQRLVSALLLISASFLRELIKRAKRIENNKEEELLIEKDIKESKEKNYLAYIEQVKLFEQKYNVSFPEFFVSKNSFMRKEYYEKRISLAVSDEDCIKIFQIHKAYTSTRGHLPRELSSTIQITESQLQCIFARAQYLLK